MKSFKVNVLGTEYTVDLAEPGEDKGLVDGRDGYCDYSTKRIVVLVRPDSYEKEPGDLEDLTYYRKGVLRHELVHAFFHESGLDDQAPWGQNEALVDWIAMQIRKMSKSMADAERKFDGCGYTK